MSTDNPKYSDAAGSMILERAARIAKAIMTHPSTPEGERDWTVDDVLGVAIWRGLDRLEELWVDGRSDVAMRAQIEPDVEADTRQ